MSDINKPRVTMADQQAAEAVIKLIDGADWDIDDKVAAKYIATAMHPEREAAGRMMELLSEYSASFNSTTPERDLRKLSEESIATYRAVTKEIK